MDKQQYLDNLKQIDLRPKFKTKVHIRNEQILLEDIGSEERDTSEVHGEIIKRFIKHPYPTDAVIQSWASEMGMTEEQLENEIYKVLSSFLSEGFSKGQNIKHDPSELRMGIEVEYEHTTNPLLSRKIALDHLSEIPDYYTRLKRMEEEAEDYWNSKNDERTRK